MFRAIFFIILMSLSVYADKKVEVFATAVDTDGSIMKANGDVVVLYDGIYVSADSATYDKTNGIIELYGNVQALQGAKYYTMGDYMMLNTQKNIRQYSPFFFQEHDDEFWTSAKSAKSQEQKYELHNGVVSSCNPQDPDWTMRFSSGYYDNENQWMQMYNARLYAGEVPVFYFPYFAYPTDTTRRTGLLRPTFGLSGDEGFMYEQPIYIAESPYWDLELLPQIRTKRGSGLYSIFRFADSPNSKGSLTIGGFKEKQGYQDEYNLKNDKHYGVEFDYQHRDFLDTWFDSDIQGTSGIFADITYLNDIEYSNLQKNDTLDYTADSQVRSRINVFLNQSENYFGVYGKYFIDLNKDTNSDTLQNLPILQYHRYLDTLLDDHFLYSFDYTGTNYYRETNKNAIQNEISVPLELQFPIFDEYLTLRFSENLYASHLSFYGSNNPDDPNDVTNINQNNPISRYTPGAYVRDSQLVELNTNLVKDFDDFSHSVSFSIGYLHPGNDKRTGFYEDYEQVFEDIKSTNGVCTGGPCEYDNITNLLEQASLEFTQFIFLADGEEKLYHRIKQPLIFEDGYNQYGDLENELRYNFTDDIYYYNNTFYDYYRNTLSKMQNTLGYSSEKFIFNFSHLYTDIEVEDRNTNTTERLKSSYITTDARYNHSSKWQYFAGYAYDIELSETKNRFIGMSYVKRCWSVELKFVENIRPTLIANPVGQTESSSIKDRILYLTVNLLPLGGADVNYKSSTVGN